MQLITKPFFHEYATNAMGLISINIFQSKHHALCMRRIINKNLDENCNILGSIQYLTLRINPDILVAIAKFIEFYGHVGHTNEINKIH